jgi:hypothetical protein
MATFLPPRPPAVGAAPPAEQVHLCTILLERGAQGGQLGRSGQLTHISKDNVGGAQLESPDRGRRTQKWFCAA